MRFSGEPADFNKALRKEQVVEIVFSAAFDMTLSEEVGNKGGENKVMIISLILANLLPSSSSDKCSPATL